MSLPVPPAAPGVRAASTFAKDKAYVNGQWIAAKDGATFDVINPATGKVIGSVPNMGVDDVNDAVDVAYKAFKTWRETSAKQRGIILRKWCNLLMENMLELSKLLTAENGKPLADSKGEVATGAAIIEWFAEESRRVYGETISSPAASKRFILIQQPVGVAGLITPWNFPNAVLVRKVAPALAAGCTVVLKPAEDTPLTALALCQLAEEAGVPPGVFNVVTSDRNHASAIGKVLCEHPLVAKISFTGSTAVGKILLQQSASTVKKVSMELGGNAPFIVFDSADLTKAVAGAMVSKYRCSGQTCVCSNRMLIQESIHDKFVEALVVETNKFKVGDGFDDATTQGPLINTRAVEKVEHLVADATSKGAQVKTGGKRHEKGPCFFQPTVLTGVNTDMECAQEEFFGPVCSIMKFKTEEEALAIANDTRVGLAGYFFSNDLNQIWRVAEKLEVGAVGINDPLIMGVELPFGGVKESGLGREGGRSGILEFTETKYICFGGLE